VEDRKKVIKQRQQELNEEIIKHQTSLDRASDTAKRLKINLSQESERQKRQVDKILEQHFYDSSSGSLEDRILQAEMKTPQLRQLEDNLTKLVSQSEWHRRKIRELRAEKNQLRDELSEIRIQEKAEFCKHSFNGLIEHAMQLLEPYRNLMDTIEEIKGLSKGLHPKVSYTERLTRGGMNSWMLTCIDSIVPRLLTQHPLEFLYLVAVYRDTKGENPFYDHTLHKLGEGPTVFGRRHDQYGPGKAADAATEIADRISEIAMEM